MASSPSTRKTQYCGSLRDREVAVSASDRQGLNFEACVWRAVPSHSSHHPQAVLLAQFSLYVHKSGLKPNSFHFIFISFCRDIALMSRKRRKALTQTTVDPGFKQPLSEK